jgi:hypothetical protein
LGGGRAEIFGVVEGILGGLGDGEALGERLGAAEAFGFDGFGGGEFAVYVGFGARGTGMEEAAVPDGDATGGTGYGRKLSRGQVFHTHEERIRQKTWESSPVWNTLGRIFSAGTWRAGRVKRTRVAKGPVKQIPAMTVLGGTPTIAIAGLFPTFTSE